ncbi:hypothetical protein HDU96_006271 [Phlyctochytrium bullatum]|nr:hypothetical protein HDU96_006271 [Phlyctochytrium bullatum]
MADNTTTTAAGASEDSLVMIDPSWTWHLGLSIGLLAWTLLTTVPVLIRAFPGVTHRLATLFTTPASTSEETSSLLSDAAAAPSNGTFAESAVVDEDPEWEVSHFEKIAQLKGASLAGRVLTFLVAAGAAGAFSRGVVAVVVELAKATRGDAVLAALVLGATFLHVTLATLAVFVGNLDPANLGGPRSGPVAIERAKRRTVALLFAMVPYFVVLALFAFVVPAVGAAAPGLAAECMLAAVCVGLVNNSIALGQLQRKKDAEGLIPSPEDDASILSRLTLYWMNPLMTFGFVDKIQASDIWSTEKYLTTPEILAEFHATEAAYKAAHPNGPRPSLVFLLWKLHWRRLAFQLVLSGMDSLLAFTGAYFLREILKATPLKGQATAAAYLCVFGMLCFNILNNLVTSAENQMVTRIGMMIRNLLSALIYEKSLRRAPVAHKPKKKPEATAAGADGKEEAPAEDDEKERAASVGKVVNLMSVDATTIGEWIGYIYSPVLTGMQILICCGALIYLLGWSAIGGVTVMTVLMFSGGPLASTINKGYAEQKAAVDRRVTAFNEVLHGIKIIKFFAWERRFYTKIDDLRQKELAIRWRVQVFEALNRVLWYSAPFMTALTSLGIYTAVMNKELTAEVAFTALSLFNTLKVPLERFPDTIIQLLDAMVSVRRIEAFLKEADMETQAVPNEVLGFKAASFVWHKPEEEEAKKPKKNKGTWKNLWGLLGKKEPEPEQQEAAPAEQQSVFELKDLSAEFANGKLSVIVGATGSGKTTLLHSLLGETHLTQGTLYSPPNVSISYVPQVAWLLNATVRDNILFGAPMDEARYRRVIKACALERDLELLEGGDLTEVGEKGINLSGGQKQRIALARACYSKAAVVILDDPLSAVDAPTAKHLMEKCVLGLLAGRTRILVTNAAGLAIPRADSLFVLHAGRIVYQGPVESVITELSSAPAFSDAGSRYAPSVAGDDTVVASSAASTYLTGISGFTDGLREMAETIVAERQKFLAESGADEKPVEADAAAGEPPKGVLVSDEVGKKLVEEETVNEGAVDLEVYKIYLRATGGIKFLAALLLGYSLNHLATLSLDGLVWLWCELSKKAQELLAAGVAPGSHFAASSAAVATTGSASLSTLASPLSAMYLFSADALHALVPFGLANATEVASVHGLAQETPRQVALRIIPLYFALMITCLTVIVVRLLILMAGSIVAGRSIHRQLMDRLLYSPVRFFEVTPIGRIVNRMTKDMAAVDRAVGTSVGNTTYNLLLIVFIVVAIAYQVPMLLVLLLPIGYIYFLIGQLFVRTCRSLKRLDSVARSPIYSHFSETLMGLTVIRAFQDSERFFRECRKRIDLYSRIDYVLSVSYTWLWVRVYLISAVIVCMVGLMLLAAGIGKNLTGLCLTFAMQVSNLMAYLVWLQSWMESNMNSMERANEYLKLEQEAPAIIEENRPPQGWPSEGRITITELRLKYAPDLPEVLQGMSLKTGAMEKVAVVGRTGAGKSSLALALFRIVEPCGGSILIDGVDILSIGLEDLRSNLTIIPQDPVLFTGTIRSNLDPFESLSDDELWLALKRAHLISSIPSGSPSVAPSTPTTEAAKPLKRADGSNDTLVLEDGASVIDVSSSSADSNEHQLTLDTAVAEGGSNLSAGQRQLLCLARALARKSRVIVMDEATASVDPETDSRIQQTIREEFSDCTVITIAHRLKTIVDYDRVVVLDHGCVIENGTPFELIESSPNGTFRKMCEETGEFEELLNMARARSVLVASRAA